MQHTVTLQNKRAGQLGSKAVDLLRTAAYWPNVGTGPTFSLV